jgi:diacylglycerol kinase (ATP)
MKDLLMSERSFQIELVIFFLLLPVLYTIDLSLVEKLFMFISLFGVLISEAINSAIERVVDLVTLDHHKMAERAKDVGSAVVFLSISLAVVVWGILLYKALF